MKHINIAIFIPHLGCPFSCIYCNQKVIAAQQEVPSIQDVTRTIEECLSTIPTGARVEAAFFGGNFTTVNQELQRQYLEAVQPYLKQGLIHGVRLSTRPDAISEPILDFLKKYGVTTIELGVQSLSDEVLRASARGYAAADVFKSARLIRDYGFELGLQLMVGLPGDDLAQDLFSARQAVSMGPQMIRIYPTLVLRGTVLEKMWQEGKYTPLSLDEAIAICTEMLLIFEEAGIPVIRLGLHPGEELRQEGTVLAGPFHPAFGERVEQAIYLEQARAAIKPMLDLHPELESVVLHVEEHELSKLIGYKRQNIIKLQKYFQLIDLTVRGEKDDGRNWIAVSIPDLEPEIKIDRKTFIACRGSENKGK